jgi:transposase InsO family protein
MQHVLNDPSTLGYRTALFRLLAVPKATAYRNNSSPSEKNPDRLLTVRIKRIAKKHKAYGYRRITAELARKGHVVNHKRVLRIMRQNNLLCRRKRRYVPNTTDSSHGLAVYPNLKPAIALTQTNQLWVADITYIGLPTGFAYLAVVLDAYSRRAIGWELGLRIDTQLTLAALTMAIDERGAPLYHHSDRGVQYASAAYVAVLQSHQVQMSMSRKGNPYDNASMESFMKTLKYEAVYLTQYETVEDARADIDHFIANVYNQDRLHSALGYRTPVEFEGTV